MTEKESAKKKNVHFHGNKSKSNSHMILVKKPLLGKTLNSFLPPCTVNPPIALPTPISIIIIGDHYNLLEQVT